jgi:hypothetical protein
MKKREVEITCSNCGYKWKTSSKMRMVSCPSCTNKTPNPLYAKQEVVLEHFNLNEDGVRILDHSIGERGWIVDVYFKPNKAWCSYCESENCNHVQFALGLDEVQKILKKKGWKIGGDV